MTWTAAGSFLFVDTASLSMNNQNIGDLVLLEILQYSNRTTTVTGITGGGCTWTEIATYVGVNFTYFVSVWAGKVTATGTQTATPTWSSTLPGFEVNGHEFISSVGSWAVDVVGEIDTSSGTANMASLTPATNGELYFGFSGNSATATAGSTPGYVYNTNGEGDATCYNLSCPAGVATFPVWGNAGQEIGIMLLMAETGGAPAVGHSLVRSQAVKRSYFY